MAQLVKQKFTKYFFVRCFSYNFSYSLKHKEIFNKATEFTYFIFITVLNSPNIILIKINTFLSVSSNHSKLGSLFYYTATYLAIPTFVTGVRLSYNKILA